MAVQLPLGWHPTSRLGASTGGLGQFYDLLLRSEWLSAAFPAFARRSDDFVRGVGEFIGESAPSLVGPVIDLLREVFSLAPEATLGAVAELHERMHDRYGDTPPAVDLVHYVVSAIGSLADEAEAHPILAANRCCGWERVPDHVAPLVGELTVVLPCWRDAFAHSSGGDTRKVELVLGAGSQANADTAASLRSYAISERISRLKVAMDDLFELPPNPGEARKGQSSLGRVVRDHRYFLTAMHCLPADSPAAHQLYESFADVCDPSHREATENVILATTSGQRRALSLLRAAVRRAYVGGDDARCGCLAEEAFSILTSQSDLPAEPAYVAAILVAATLPSRTDSCDRPGLQTWLQRALSVAGGESAESRFFLHRLLNAACAAVGDERGASTAFDDAFAVLNGRVPASHLPVTAAKDARAQMRFEWGPFVGVEALLELGHVDDADELLAKKLGEMSESADRDLLRMLLEREVDSRLAVLDGASERRFPPWVTATLAAWACGGLAELHDADGDFAGWHKWKVSQFRLEDRHWALPEHEADVRAARDSELEAACKLDEGDRAGGTPWSELERWLLHRLEHAPQDPAFRRVSAIYLPGPSAARIRRCIQESERALADGETGRARLWAARATELRRRFA